MFPPVRVPVPGWLPEATGSEVPSRARPVELTLGIAVGRVCDALRMVRPETQ